jgi:hypothetical protein
MLAHSPPLPLDIEYQFGEDDDITAEDEEGAILALKQCDRVRRVRILIPAENQKFILAMDDEYPILEYLIVGSDRNAISTVPETLQAPHLRHLNLATFDLPAGSRLLTSAVSLVTLYLFMDNLSTYVHSNILLRWLSLMPQLEILDFFFVHAIPDRDIERQLTHTPIATPVTLPNLRRFTFRGDCTYLEALVNWIITPRLERLGISIFDRHMYSVPRLLQFVNATENLTFKSAKFKFSGWGVGAMVYPQEEAEMYALKINVECMFRGWQVSSAAQIFNSLSPAFFAVEHLTFEHKYKDPDKAAPTEWRKLLSSFRNVKTFRIAGEELVEALSDALELDDGELSLDLLPRLHELTYSGSGDTGDTFTSFIDSRQNAGRPITLIRS